MQLDLLIITQRYILLHFLHTVNTHKHKTGEIEIVSRLSWYVLIDNDNLLRMLTVEATSPTFRNKGDLLKIAVCHGSNHWQHRSLLHTRVQGEPRGFPSWSVYLAFHETKYIYNDLGLSRFPQYTIQSVTPTNDGNFGYVSEVLP